MADRAVPSERVAPPGVTPERLHGLMVERFPGWRLTPAIDPTALEFPADVPADPALAADVHFRLSAPDRAEAQTPS